jgi:hypothetical protein
VTRAGAARWTEWALRLSLATAFLSGVADRLGAWGPHGSPHASWGDWHHFRIYADRLNWYMPAAVQPAAAVLATAGEVIFAIAHWSHSRPSLQEGHVRYAHSNHRSPNG